MLAGILLTVLGLTVFGTPAAHALTLLPGKRLFLVTAYYSPLYGQDFYIKGSLEADKRLNGRGTNGADGTEVYVGMLAAPKTYPFGTKISLPGLGVGTVHDRGGAILSHASYDRIDVWMGRGEQGLARALSWGKRLVEGEVLPAETPESIDFTWLSDTIPEPVRQRTILPAPSGSVVPDAAPSVREFQEMLRRFGYYRGELTGILTPDTREAILTFQLDYGIVESPFEPGAGHFGPKTRAMLLEKRASFNAEVESERQFLKQNTRILTPGLGKSSRGDAVTILQQILTTLGYYHGPMTGVYDRATIASVFDFQRRHQVVTSELDRGAGYFGKQTHVALVAAVDTRMDRVEALPLAKQMEVPRAGEWVADPVAAQNFVPLQGESTHRKPLNFALFADNS